MNRRCSGFFAFMSLLAVSFLAVTAGPCFGQEKNYTIEVLQVTDIGVFDQAYKGFLDVLEKNGLVQGKNLTVNRKVIDFNVEKGGLWDKVKVLFNLKSEASRIVEARPDLILTIGTPATKYTREKAAAAGIPLVFTAVAIPEAAGCKSMVEAGPGFTGSTLYMNMTDVFKILQLAFPNAETYGIIHSDDENGIAQAGEAQGKAPRLGLQVITKEVNKSDNIKPVARDLVKQGVDIFILPLDTYYGLKDNRNSHDLLSACKEDRVLLVSLAMNKIPGAALYVGTSFGAVGSLSGTQAVKILKENVHPEELPVLRQEDLTVMVDTEAMKTLGIQIPLEILQIAVDVK